MANAGNTTEAGSVGVLAGAPPRGVVSVFAGAMFVALSILMLFGIWSVVTLGGWTEGVALLGGQHLYVAQPVIDIGEAPAGQTVTVEFGIQNLSGESLTVLGAKTDCSCVVTSGLPLTLEPRERSTLQLHVTPSPRDTGEQFERRIELYTDHSAESVWVVINGIVIPGPTEDRAE